jgi:hypothetical protein
MASGTGNPAVIGVFDEPIGATTPVTAMLHMSKEKPMLTRTAIGFLTGSVLMLGALPPALADIGQCAKLPNADTCPTFGKPTPPPNAAYETPYKHVRHGHYYRRYLPENG